MNKELYNRKIRIPEKILSHLENEFESCQGDSNVEGFNRNKELREKKYVTYPVMKRWKNWFDTNETGTNSYRLNGGDLCKDWVNNQLDYMRNDVAQSEKNKNVDVDVRVIEQINKINKLIHS